MANPSPYSPSDRRLRDFVRLLFLFAVLYFAAGMIIRKMDRLFYPGFFMPSFAGVGLAKMTADEGEIPLPHVIVRFRDQTGTETTQTQLFGRDNYPTIVISRIFALKAGANPPAAFSVPADVRAYIQRKLAICFPHRDVESVSFQIERESFPLDQPQNRKIVGLVDRVDVVFPHENAGREN